MLRKIMNLLYSILTLHFVSFISPIVRKPERISCLNPAAAGWVLILSWRTMLVESKGNAQSCLPRCRQYRHLWWRALVFIGEFFVLLVSRCSTQAHQGKRTRKLNIGEISFPKTYRLSEAQLFYASNYYKHFVPPGLIWSANPINFAHLPTPEEWDVCRYDTMSNFEFQRNGTINLPKLNFITHFWTASTVLMHALTRWAHSRN